MVSTLIQERLREYKLNGCDCQDSIQPSKSKQTSIGICLTIYLSEWFKISKLMETVKATFQKGSTLLISPICIYFKHQLFTKQVLFLVHYELYNIKKQRANGIGS